ncbi:hypothetical protein VRRI112168_02910 [Vreelandella rituensis]|uniref:Uncharacterized protein n=1 Tax=Vreelandella rituensis TaxID=2282306 RepID=A0A368UBH3_9GAMM|nr:hypothetical protein [Halomonas rituensis]RCV93692.1 hypothetical protein DU506_00630 [Halomonas rituensis]
MATRAFHLALEDFRQQMAIEDMSDLRDQFYASAGPGPYDHSTLIDRAKDFLEAKDLKIPAYQVVSLLMGTGEHHFHHLEHNLGHVFQSDMPTLAQMIEQDAKATHAAHLEHDPASIPPLPAYLHHQRQRISLEAVERRNDQWRHYHFTSLHAYLLERLEGNITAIRAELLPMARHRVDHGENRVERQHVPLSLSENLVRGELTLFTKRLAHDLADRALKTLAKSQAIPARIGILREPQAGPGIPDPLWIVALVHPADAAHLPCADIEDALHQLGMFELDPWFEEVVAWANEQASLELAREIKQLKIHFAHVQGPPEPYRVIMNADLDRLMESTL